MSTKKSIEKIVLSDEQKQDIRAKIFPEVQKDARWDHDDFNNDGGRETIVKINRLLEEFPNAVLTAEMSDCYSCSIDKWSCLRLTWTVPKTLEEIEEEFNRAVSYEESRLNQAWEFKQQKAANEKQQLKQLAAKYPDIIKKIKNDTQGSAG